MNTKQVKSLNILSNDENLVALSKTGFNKLEMNYFIKKRGFHLYQVRHHDDHINQPETLEEKVTVNHYCDVILKEPIDFGDTDYVELSDDDKTLLKRHF